MDARHRPHTTTTESATTRKDPTMTTITIPNHAVETTTTTARRPGVRAATRSEWIKLRSLRSTPALLAITALIGVAMTVVLGAVVKTDPYEHLPFTLGNTLVVSTLLSTMLAMVAGTLLFTSEVQHGTLAVAFTARPARRVVVAAKAVVAAGLGLAMGAAGMVGSLIGGVASGMDTGDLSGAPAQVAWGLVLTTFAAVLGLGVGMIVRHSAAAVTGVLVWSLAVENLVRGMAPTSVSRFFPFSAADRLLGTRAATDSAETLAAALPNIANAAIFGAYAAIAVAVGTAIVMRKDS